MPSVWKDMSVVYAILYVAGCTNMFLDFIFVGVLGLGVQGAASATAVSEFLGGGIPLIYFIKKNDSRLQLHWTSVDLRITGQASFNGVSAYGVIMYVAFVFAAIFFGYTVGSSPIVGLLVKNKDRYHYGNRDWWRQTIQG